MTMKLPSIQTDLQAVPEQPEMGEMVIRAQEEREEAEILTETGEEREEAEEEEGDDDQEEVGFISRIGVIKVGLNVLAYIEGL